MDLWKLSEDEQTAQQKALFAYHLERARAASAAATADVLQFLDKQGRGLDTWSLLGKLSFLQLLEVQCMDR